MSAERTSRAISILQHTIAPIITSLTPPGVIATLQSIDLSPDGKYATINVSVLPELQEAAVLAELIKNIHLFRETIAKETRLQNVPELLFLIDQGEKKRHHIDTLLSGEDGMIEN